VHCRKLGEKAMVKVIPNTGHLPQQEDTKLFNRVLLAPTSDAVAVKSS
jgi:pimeloyl-ACP methyl ester carboxylesterase